MPELVQGIVLDSFKFKENSVVCKVFTQQHGILSIMINGIGKKTSHVNMVYMQPLTLLEFVVYLKEKRGIQRVKEISLVKTPLGILPEIKRYSIAGFVAEVVLRTFKEHETDERLYELLCHVVSQIQDADIGIQDLHLFFLCHYSVVLGFDIRSDEKGDSNMRIGELDKQSHLALNQLLEMEQYYSLSISKIERRKLVRFILYYLGLHLEMPRIKSLDILEEVMS